jgi:deoxycytidylate deaminase
MPLSTRGGECVTRGRTRTSRRGCNLVLQYVRTILANFKNDQLTRLPFLPLDSCPCLRCSVKIVQTGVKEVVYNLNYSMDAQSAKVLREGGVTLRQLVMPHTST